MQRERQERRDKEERERILWQQMDANTNTTAQSADSAPGASSPGSGSPQPTDKNARVNQPGANASRDGEDRAGQGRVSGDLRHQGEAEDSGVDVQRGSVAAGDALGGAEGASKQGTGEGEGHEEAKAADALGETKSDVQKAGEASSEAPHSQMKNAPNASNGNNDGEALKPERDTHGENTADEAKAPAGGAVDVTQTSESAVPGSSVNLETGVDAEKDKKPQVALKPSSGNAAANETDGASEEDDKRKKAEEKLRREERRKKREAERRWKQYFAQNAMDALSVRYVLHLSMCMCECKRMEWDAVVRTRRKYTCM